MDPGVIDPLKHSLAVNVIAPPAPQRAEQREVIQAVHAVNKAELFGQNNELTFQLDPETRRPIVRIVDRETWEVVAQIPPEKVLRLARDLQG